MKILIVEDNEICSKVLRANLKKLNFEVDCAYNWQEAIALFITKNYSLIFTDIGLPHIHGLTLCRILRLLEKDLEKQYTPIFAATAYSITDDLLNECYDCGINGAIQKPYSMHEIEKALSGAIPTQESNYANFN